MDIELDIVKKEKDFPMDKSLVATLLKQPQHQVSPLVRTWAQL